ncbi:MAG: DUF6444 domain-containing protein [Armatimonadota bacterium]
MSQPPHEPVSPEPVTDDVPTDIPTLQQMVRDLHAVVLPLQEQVRALTEAQYRNSRNSSRPPSSDPPWRQRPSKPPSGKKWGGQSGHSGKFREFLPIEAVDQVVVVAPPACEPRYYGAKGALATSRR